MTNETQPAIGYALWAIFARPVGAGTGSAAAEESTLPEAVEALAASGVTLWLTGDDAQRLQAALRSLRRTAPLAPLVPRWNALGVHRDAEFTRDHSPSFMRGLPPKQWVSVYPFVRSLDWYILPEDERRGMLSEHGLKGRDFPQVQPNTVAAFALGDYEWILALEADDPIDLVDMMRHLRATEARRHVREEVPFFTGRLIGLDELAEVLA
jgi:chlorite dismutase